MADVSNLKINQRSIVERPNLRITKIGNKNWEHWFISKGKYGNWQNYEQSGMSNGRTIPNLSIFRAKFWFSKLKKFWKLKKKSIWKIQKI